MPTFQRKRVKTDGYRKRSRFGVRNTRRRRYRPTRFKSNKGFVATGLGFPKRMKMVHKYVDTVVIQSTAGAVGSYVFACNGMYDPDKTATGHQPMFFDQMSGIYNHYHVIGAKITVKIVPASDNAIQTPTHFVLTTNDDTVALSDLNAVRERAGAKYALLNPEDAKSVTLTSKWSAKKTFGGSVLGNDQLQGDIDANPVENTHWVIQIQSANLSSTTVAYLNVTIQYIAIWDEMKDIASS